jgi:ABC-type multidrug transport system fused ATPase/permease subunit
VQENAFERDYQERAERWQHDADLLEGQRARLSNFRLAAGGAMIAAALYWVFTRELYGVPAAIIAGIILALLVRRYRQLTALWERASALATVNRYGAARVQRDWAALPEPPPIEVPDGHPYARDLDIIGHASLQQLVDTTGTTMGRDRLADWLLDPIEPSAIPAQQDAVRELSGDLDWLQELQQRALRGKIDDEQTSAFLEWIESPGLRLPVLTWLARLSVLGLLAIVALSIARVIDSSLLAFAFVVNLVISAALHRKAGQRLDAAIEHGTAIRSYAELLELLSHRPHTAALLREIDAPLQIDGVAASDAAEKLAKILSYGVPRGSLQSYVMQAAVAWDVHFYDRLEAWREQYGTHVPGWLDAIGWYEALGAWANLAHDNPAWVYPNLSRTNDRLSATELGHALIPESRRVCNDVTTGPPGTFLFVTGSNMSGKSTLLRSVGMNVVLANMGGPACARTMALPPISLWTSVRIVDSLEAGISYYMAELLRLKQVVDAALADTSDERTICFLLDEILSGTNTGERQIAARRIISLLVDHGAIGAVSTHDLDLIEGDSLSAKAQKVHFTETVMRSNGVLDMTFDYKLRPGLATSTNALKLMELVGIPLQDQPGSTL